MKALTDYTSKELESLQLSLSIAYQANSVLHGRDAESNQMIMRWADDVSAALREVKLEEQIKEEVQQ